LFHLIFLIERFPKSTFKKSGAKLCIKCEAKGSIKYGAKGSIKCEAKLCKKVEQNVFVHFSYENVEIY
jgi:hypothetical protein